MLVFERAVEFDDVDAAGIVFFARFLSYAHEAMARAFDGVPGGYVALITQRRIGFPAVHVAADFRAPLRYGDAIRIETTLPRIGTTSCTFRHRFVRMSDGVEAAVVDHVVVATSLETMTKVALPRECRNVLEPHAVA